MKNLTKSHFIDFHAFDPTVPSRNPEKTFFQQVLIFTVDYNAFEIKRNFAPIKIRSLFFLPRKRFEVFRRRKSDHKTRIEQMVLQIIIQVIKLFLLLGEVSVNIENLVFNLIHKKMPMNLLIPNLPLKLPKQILIFQRRFQLEIRFDLQHKRFDVFDFSDHILTPPHVLHVGAVILNYFVFEMYGLHLAELIQHIPADLSRHNALAVSHIFWIEIRHLSSLLCIF